ncbi:Protein EMP47 [Paramyrothecium foliicola]|nr:Protein EMP47 [Paramyrothecium foliicola]
MRFAGLDVSLAVVLGASLAQAQFLINELSFGYTGRMAPPESPDKITGFTTHGKPSAPEILSNKLVLTPVYAGNQRGSVWSEKPLTITEWVADVDFRANGPERGGGNLNIWLVRGGQTEVGSSSIYTAGKFDGLALVVDQHGGSGGMLRGFLNDGTKDYSQHHNVDELAFGHCLYAYRNLGRPSQIKLRQTDTTFKVEVDGRLCFESDKVRIPPGNHFGISAATPDNPDSFEVFKLVVMSETAHGSYNGNNDKKQDTKAEQQQQQQQQQKQEITQKGSQRVNLRADEADPFKNSIPDEEADKFETSKAQFQDLHIRLQATNHQITTLYHLVGQVMADQGRRGDEVKELLAGINQQLAKLDQVDELQRRIRALEQEVRGLHNDLGKKIQANERNVHSLLSDHHATMSQTLIDMMPRHRTLLLIFVGLQGVLVAGYVVYKRRKSSLPKKYL